MINSVGRRQISRIASPSARRLAPPLLRLIAIAAQAVILLLLGLALAFAILNVPVSG